MDHNVMGTPCPECQSGRMKLTGALLFVGRADRPLCVPDFPAWVCDLCGLREYDHGALSELEVMLDSIRPRMSSQRRSAHINNHDLVGRDAESGRRPSHE